MKNHITRATTTAYADQRDLPQELQVLLVGNRLTEVLGLLELDAIEQRQEIPLAPSAGGSARKQIAKRAQRILALEEVVVDVRYVRKCHDGCSQSVHSRNRWSDSGAMPMALKSTSIRVCGDEALDDEFKA